MKKITTLLIILFSFFIASREVNAFVPDDCNQVTVMRFNASANTLGNMQTVCSYRPLGITPLTLDDTNGVSYVNIYNINNSHGDIYYFVGVTEYKTKARELEMLACTVKRSDGTKEAHTKSEGWHINGTPQNFDDDTFDNYFPYYSDDNGIFVERDPGEVSGAQDINLYDELDGWYGTTTTIEEHSNKHYCPAYAGKITASPLDRGPYSTLAYLTRDYDNNMEIPTTLNDGTFTTDYFKPLTYAASNFYSDSVNTETGEVSNMTTVSQTNYFRSHTNNTLSTAVSNSEVINDWDSCNQYGVLKTLDIVHTALLILRIMVPLVLIILGTIDFGKAGISGDDDLVTKATKTIIRRAILGVVIFFIPTLMYAFANLAGDRNNSESSDFYKCTSCFTGEQDCDSYLQTAEGKVETN